MPRKLKNLTIGEISIVDKPAHVPAVAALEKAAGKRDRSEAEVKKAVAEKLKKNVSIDLYAYFYTIYDDIDLQFAVDKIEKLIDVEIPAIARFIKDQAEALGLSDELPADGVFAMLVSKSANNKDREGIMPKETDPAIEKATDKLKAEIEALTKQRDEAVAALEKAKTADRVEALTKQRDEAVAALEKAKAAETAIEALTKQRDEAVAALEKAKAAETESEPDAPVYKARDGREYREPESIELAKKLDDEQADRELEARVNKEFAHIPGDMATRKAVVKALDAIPDEAQRKAALANLSERDAELAKAFKPVGDIGKAVEDSSGTKEFEKALEGDENLTPEKVAKAFLETHRDWDPRADNHTAS